MQLLRNIKNKITFFNRTKDGSGSSHSTIRRFENAGNGNAAARSLVRETPENSPKSCAFRLLRRIIAMLLLIFAAFSFIYWIACLIGAGSGISELWIWPAASVFFMMCFLWITGRGPFARLHRIKWLRATAAALLVIVFVFFITVECFVISGMDDDGAPGLDYIIVLGAHVRGTIPSSALKWRIERAYEYLTDNPETVAIASGGKGAGEDISEAECIRRELMALGISGDRILIEDKSTSTMENISFSLEIIGNSDAGIGVVTNNFHVWRAVKTALRAGASKAVGISAPFRNLLIFHYMAREFFSIVLNNICGYM